jgi:hypothetical protein
VFVHVTGEFSCINDGDSDNGSDAEDVKKSFMSDFVPLL